MAMARGFWNRPSEMPRDPQTLSNHPIVFPPVRHPETKAVKAKRQLRRVIRR
jgi:hypothetical protein